MIDRSYLTRDEVLKIIRENGIKFVELWFGYSRHFKSFLYTCRRG